MKQTNKSADYFGVDIPFMAHIGLIPETFSPELTRTRLPYRKEISNSRGEIHGGTLMGALDFTLSAAARAKDPSTGMATIDMSTHFMAPARGTVIFEAKCLRMGRSLAFCEGRALNEHGELLATASATFKIMRSRAQSENPALGRNTV